MENPKRNSCFAADMRKRIVKYHNRDEPISQNEILEELLSLSMQLDNLYNMVLLKLDWLPKSWEVKDDDGAS